MIGYTTRDVARMLDLSVAQVRAFARSGLLSPERGARGELRFSFQDLVLLQTARGLVSARLPQRKVRRALRRLKEQLPNDRPLSGVRITAQGSNVVVRDGDTVWNPDSGQVLLDFEVAELARKAAPAARRAAQEARSAERQLSADDWFHLANELEEVDLREARDAYRRAVELDPYHADAHINLGRLLHETGELGPAEAHYRLALAARADSATAAFNLGVVLEDQGKLKDALLAYEQALENDPRYADAHYNLARVCERLGKMQAAIRHLSAYRNLTRERT
jgi:tetratricopeptide (TPR) repeat protein